MSEAHDIEVQAGEVTLPGNLIIPRGALGLTVFVHGSGSSRFSSRNRYVADILNQGRIGTLLFDLLTPQEEQRDARTREYRFDIELLSRRVTATLDWLQGQPERVNDLPVGLFGASTGAAAALNAVARRPQRVQAVVSRGGRPDLAADALARITVPTLLIVGGLDQQVLDLNRQAARAIGGACRIEVVEGATHLFEEPGTLEQVAALARDWLLEQFDPTHARGHGEASGARS